MAREPALGAGSMALLLAGPETEAGPYPWAAIQQVRWRGSFPHKGAPLLSIILKGSRKAGSGARPGAPRPRPEPLDWGPDGLWRTSPGPSPTLVWALP